MGHREASDKQIGGLWISFDNFVLVNIVESIVRVWNGAEDELRSLLFKEGQGWMVITVCFVVGVWKE